MKLYGFWRSLATYRVKVAMALKGVAAQEVSIDLLKGGQHDREYVALNPQAVVEGGSPRFGLPQRLNLDGRGVRDVARSGERYLILAGPAEGGGRHRLYSWAGGDAVPVEQPKVVPKGFQAEGLVAGVGGASVDLLADDDSEKIDGKRCENLEDLTRRSFRALRVGL